MVFYFAKIIILMVYKEHYMFMGTSMVSKKRPHIKNYQEYQEKRIESSWLILKDETAL